MPVVFVDEEVARRRISGFYARRDEIRGYFAKCVKFVATIRDGMRFDACSDYAILIGQVGARIAKS
jgi:hypothetical protein